MLPITRDRAMIGTVTSPMCCAAPMAFQPSSAEPVIRLPTPTAPEFPVRKNARTLDRTGSERELFRRRITMLLSPNSAVVFLCCLNSSRWPSPEEGLHL